MRFCTHEGIITDEEKAESVSKKRIHQIGSVGSFIVVAIILAVVTVGVITFVQQRAEQARKDEATKIASGQQQEAANEAAPADTSSDEPAVSGDVGTTPATELPATGPESDILQVLALGTLGGLAVSYVISRRQLTRSL